MAIQIFSIGHSSRSIDQFVAILKTNNINLLVDVRSSPYSKYAPQFNREILKAKLEDENIAYKFFGDKLGGRPPEGIDNFIHTKKFRDNTKELIKNADSKSAAIMCSELDQEQCHRRFIIEEITQNGISVTVIGKEIKIIPAKDPTSQNIFKRASELKQMTLF